MILSVKNSILSKGVTLKDHTCLKSPPPAKIFTNLTYILSKLLHFSELCRKIFTPPQNFGPSTLRGPTIIFLADTPHFANLQIGDPPERWGGRKFTASISM